MKIIGNYCFRNNNLIEIKLPASLTEINSLAFYENKLTSITIPKNISLVGNMAFSRNDLIEVVIKGSETRILSNSFNINGPSRISNSITEAPFNGTWKLTSDDNYKDWIRLSDSDNTDNYDELTIGEAIAQGFIFNNGIITRYDGANKHIVIPKKINNTEVAKIGNNAFKGKNITSVSLPNTLIELGNNAFEGNNLTSIIMPNSITKIGSYCFRSNNLNSIKFSIKLTEIPSLAFYNNKLTSIDIPSHITQVGNNAFGLNNLTRVGIQSSETAIQLNAFDRNGPSRASNSITRAPFNGTWKLTNDDNYKDWIKE